MKKSGRKKGKIGILAVLTAFSILFSGMSCCVPVQAANGGYNAEVDEGIAVVAVWAKGTLYVADQALNVYDQQSYDDWWGQGTGFFVGEEGEDPQYLLTNHHVVADYLEHGKGSNWEGYVGVYDSSQGLYYYFQGQFSVRVYYSEDDYDDAVVVDYLDQETDADCAILKLDQPTDQRKPLTLMVPTEEMRGETVYAVGYPAISENTMTDASKWSMADATVTTGTIGKLVTASGNRVHRIQMDAEINHGNSGGPLVTAGDGYVIGLNTNGWSEDGATLYYAVNIDHAMALMDKNNIPYTTADDKKGSPVAVVIVIVVVVILAAAAGVVVLKKKKDGKPAKASAPAGNSSAAGNSAAAGNAPKARGPVARSLAAQHNGLSVSISQKPIMVGRDRASCAIAYAEGTAGVSGKHCTIAFDLSAQSFIVTDVGSSYGTFLMSGQRLQPNVPCKLKVGDSFYVGDRANVIRLELG